MTARSEMELFPAPAAIPDDDDKKKHEESPAAIPDDDDKVDHTMLVDDDSTVPTDDTMMLVDDTPCSSSSSSSPLASSSSSSFSLPTTTYHVGIHDESDLETQAVDSDLEDETEELQKSMSFAESYKLLDANGLPYWRFSVFGKEDGTSWFFVAATAQ